MKDCKGWKSKYWKRDRNRLRMIDKGLEWIEKQLLEKIDMDFK